MKGVVYMKRYKVIAWGKLFIHELEFKSLKMARFVMNLIIWEYAKINDIEDNNKCIEIRDRRRSK